MQPEDAVIATNIGSTFAQPPACSPFGVTLGEVGTWTTARWLGKWRTKERNELVTSGANRHARKTLTPKALGRNRRNIFAPHGKDGDDHSGAQGEVRSCVAHRRRLDNTEISCKRRLMKWRALPRKRAPETPLVSCISSLGRTQLKHVTMGACSHGRLLPCLAYPHVHRR